MYKSFFLKVTLNFLVSVLVPLVSAHIWSGTIKPIDQVFLGMFVFTIVALVHTADELNKIRHKSEDDSKLWDIQSASDVSLNNVRRAFVDISRRMNSIFTLFFQQRIKELEQSISEAANNEQLAVSQNADTTEMMLQDFLGSEEDICRFVHYFKDNDFLFDVHASHFFAEVARLVESGKIRGVRRLFIMTAENELEEDRSKRLIAFHAHTKSFDYKIMPAREFDQLRRDYNLPADTYDFGIYASRFVYRGLTTAPQEVRGIFSCSASVVGRFMSLFERCWTSQAAFTLPKPNEAISLQDLFGRAPVSPNRPGITQQVIGLPERT